MKKQLIALMISTLTISTALLGGCGTSGNTDTAETKTESTAAASEDTTTSSTDTDTASTSESISSSSTVVEIPNPFIDYATIEEALEHLDFDVNVPASLDAYDDINISVMDNSMFQIVYRNDTDEICIRKAAKTDDTTDISGDYNTYSNTETKDIDGRTVTLRGDDTIRNAIWSTDEYIYSIYSKSGLSEDQAETLILSVQ